MRNLISLLVIAMLLTAAFAQESQPTLEREAQAGNVSAELRLGRAYQYGNGIAKDLRKAIYWLQTACHDGSAEAAFILGTMAYNGDALGDNVRESLENAWAWFEVAKVMNYPEASEAIARLESEMTEIKIRQAHEIAATMFLEGSVTPTNSPAALDELHWLEQHGSSAAKLMLGNMYRSGSGVSKDLAKAREYCNEALKMHVPGAGYCLAQIYDEQGDQKAAFESIEKDAYLGLVSAVLELAQRLRDGRGTKPNPVDALAWVIRAESGGVTSAAEMRLKFVEGLSDKQIAEAKKKAGELKVTSAHPPRPVSLRGR